MIIRFFISIFVFCFVFLFIGSTVSADPQINLGAQQSYGIPAVNNPNASVGVILSNVIRIMFIIGGLSVLVFILWGAFDWITSGGDKEKIAGARRKIINALIGLALLALAGFIVSLFGQIVGFNPLNTPPLPKLDDPVKNEFGVPLPPQPQT